MTRLHELTPADFLAAWLPGNAGLCRVCNAAAPTADPLLCPSGCDLRRPFETWRRFEAARGHQAAAPAPVSAPAPSRSVALPRTAALACEMPNGHASATLRRQPKKTTPFLSVRVAGTLVISEEAAITKPNVREAVTARCPEDVRPWLASALLELAEQWSTTPPDEREERTDGKARLTRDVELWPEPVDACAVLDALLIQIRKHIALPEHGDIVMTLWIAHAHFIEHLRFTPYLHLTSPTKACGKTTALELLELTTPRPWRISNPTGAVMFRTIERERPTLLLDEIDTISAGPKFDDLTGVLNDGWHAAGKVARCDGDDNEVRTFSVFSAKALAGIGTTLQDATTSRCIRLPMARATGDALAKLTQLRTDRAERWAAPLRQQLARLAADAGPHVAALLQDDDTIEMPRGVDGRDAQAWEPLLAVADLAGEEWGAVARLACVALVQARRANDDGDVRVRLLGDVRAFFTERGCEMATSRAIIGWLVEDEARGWAEYRGKELTPESLARLLKPFNVGPKKRRDGAETARVWLRGELLPVWDKYLDPSTQPATLGTRATPATPVPSVPGVPCHTTASAHVPSGSDEPPAELFWKAIEAESLTVTEDLAYDDAA